MSKMYEKAFGKLKALLEKRYPDIGFDMEVIDDGDLVHVVISGSRDVDVDEPDIMISRIINTKDNSMKLDVFAISEDLQGRGLAKEIHKHHLKLARDFGIKEFYLEANMDVGGYAWIRSGFTPTNLNSFRRSIQANWVKRGAGQSIKPLLDELMLTTPEKAYEMVRANPARYKTLLLGTYWEGKIDLTDKESVDYYERWINSSGPITRGTSPHLLNNAGVEQVRLERAKAGLVPKIQKAIQNADRDVRDLLSKLTVEKLNQLSTSEQGKLLKALEGKINGVFSDYLAELEKDLEEMSKITVGREETALNAAMATATVTPLAYSKAYESALKNPIAATGDLLRDYISDIPRNEVRRMNREIRKSIVTGRTVQQTIVAVRGTKEKGFRDGLLNTTLNDLRTIMRTSIQHVNSVSRGEVWKANTDLIDGYQWVSTLDSHTSPRCRVLDNQVFEFGQGPLPPIHPNCRSTTTPHFKDSVDLWDDSATRSSASGYVPQGTSFYSWLKDQPDSFIIETLGPTRAKLFDTMDAAEFSNMQLDKNFNPLTLDEMRKLHPAAFRKANI